MANRILDYLGVVWGVVQYMDKAMDVRVTDADNGENSDITEGKRIAIDQIDALISELKTAREDIEKMPFTKLQNKYN